MGRWEPDARGRLARAALELYGERGYEATTVADIAARAGLTERTFFRHFVDKREVLFDAQSGFSEAFVDAARTAPDTASPLQAAALGAYGAAAMLQKRHEFARRRSVVIAAHADLRERELIKLADVADTMARALVDRGVSSSAAGLAAEAAMAVFRVAFDRWVGSPTGTELADLLTQGFAELAGLTAAAPIVA